MLIRARAPTRISFAGGGTDIRSYFDIHGGCVLNTTITPSAYFYIEPRYDDNIGISSIDLGERLEFNSTEDIKLDGRLDLIKAIINNFKFDPRGLDFYSYTEVPKQSGLGTSSSLCAAAIEAIGRHLELKMSKQEQAELSYKIEREILGIKGGYQDQYAAAFGGFNFIEFSKDKIKVAPLQISSDHLMELENNIVLFYMAPRESSGVIHEQMAKSIKEGEDDKLRALHRTVEIAHEIKTCLESGDFAKFGELMDIAWNEKKKFSSGITNDFIDKIYEKAKENGAIGGKISGSGGGGCAFFYIEPSKKARVIKSLEDSGVKNIPFRFDKSGSASWVI